MMLVLTWAWLTPAGTAIGAAGFSGAEVQATSASVARNTSTVLFNSRSMRIPPGVV